MAAVIRTMVRMASEESRLIVLTGATRGLGRALVAEFVARGHTVCGCGRSANHVAALREKFGRPHAWDVVDVTNAAVVSAWAGRVMDAGRVPDLLINNAGIINPPLRAWEMSAETFDAVIDVNIKGVGNVIRAFAPAIVRHGHGVIVNMSSGWGRSVSPQVAPYCATKWAIEGLSKAMAEEVPAGVAIVPLNPGIIDTEMLRTCWGESAAGFPVAEAWARAAAPFILGLGPRDNGRSVTAPTAGSD